MAETGGHAQVNGRENSTPRPHNAVLSRDAEYWRDRLSGLETVRVQGDLALQPRRPAVADEARSEVAADVTRGLRALATSYGVSLFMATLAAFETVLTHWTGSADIAVLSPVAARSGEATGANTVILRADLSGNPRFSALLAQVKMLVLDAYAHKSLPFEQVVREVAPEWRRTGDHPLSSIAYALQVGGSARLPQPAAVADAELSVMLTEGTDNGLAIDVAYDASCYRRTTIERLIASFQAVLSAVVSEPDGRIGDLELLTTAEREQLATFHGPPAPPPDRLTVHELVQARAEHTPAAVALDCGDRTITYRELDERANQVALALHARGIGDENPVGVCLHRGPDLIVALLGILKAGAAYLPLDPAYPEQRLQFMLEDTGAALLIAQESLTDKLDGLGVPRLLIDADWPSIAQFGTTSLELTTVGPDSLAYIIFTSGSTGRPNGVMVEHRSLLNFAAQLPGQLRISQASRILQFTSPSFDVSLAEIFGTLLAGGTLVIADSSGLMPGAALEETIVGRRADVVIITPSVLGTLRPEALSGVRTLVIGGEPCHPDVIASWAKGRHLVNAYGPTETSIGVVFHHFDPAENKVVIGCPIANTSVYVVDRFGGLAPLGVPGELWIGGPGVARGYWNRPELTAERFVADRFGGGGRLYRSGDLVRWLPGGVLEFLGRMDEQVKIRGLRVELGEVQSVLAGAPGVGSAVVVVRDDGPGGRRLVGYCVPGAGGAVDAAAVRGACRARLPEYMVPQLVVLDALPLTPNGKVDRRALPAPGVSRLAGDGEFVAPRTEVEAAVAGMWCEVLGVERVGVHDNFFALGGHSLLATRVVNKVEQLTGLEVSLKEFLLAPTVAALTGQVVRAFVSEDAGDRAVLAAGREDGGA
jgi:amino acid adenylation domain-containing protein